MKTEIIEASLFSLLPKHLQKDLIASGLLPINDIFYQHWNDDSKILMLYGGYGSGKSVFLVDKLIDECGNNQYFRCFFGRKVYDTVRDSIFLTITDRIEERGLQREFLYSKSDNSSMIIRSRETGGTFNPFGADKAEKLKSVKDPSHILCDELDQFTADDFGVLLSRLRTQKVKTKMMCAFNTTKVKEDHWLKTTFFGEHVNNNFSHYSITKIFCNYPDNYFINHKEYEQTLWISSGFNEQKFNEISAGEWGSDQKNNTFIYSLRKKQAISKRPGYPHLIEGLIPDYSMPLITSFDFNVEPITASIWQHASDLSWISGLQEYRLMNSDIFELCERIMTDHPEAYFKVTGDASGRSRTAITRGNKNYFQIIKSLLKINSRQFVLPTKNPYHSNTRVLANLLFAKHPALLMNRSMQYLIADIDNVEIDETGGIAKGKDKHKSHLLDTMLSYFWNFHRPFLLKYKVVLPVRETVNAAEIV